MTGFGFDLSDCSHHKAVYEMPGSGSDLKVWPHFSYFGYKKNNRDEIDQDNWRQEKPEKEVKMKP